MENISNQLKKVQLELHNLQKMIDEVSDYSDGNPKVERFDSRQAHLLKSNIDTLIKNFTLSFENEDDFEFMGLAKKCDNIIKIKHQDEHKNCNIKS